MARKKIIYIDDEPEMIKLFRLILERQGFEFIGAVDGKAGLEAVRRVKPDLILLDLMMPGMDGEQVNQQLKADEELQDIPVIIVSAKYPNPALLESIGQIDGYVLAPCGPQELLESVTQVLQIRRDEEQANSQ